MAKFIHVVLNLKKTGERWVVTCKWAYMTSIVASLFVVSTVLLARVEGEALTFRASRSSASGGF